jgi:hypothetical protein
MVGTLEDAGGGNLRRFRCVFRGGVLIPIFSYVSPAQNTLAEAPKIKAMAMAIVRGKGASH